MDAEQSESVAALLSARADVNTCDPQGSSPLHYAALLGSEPIARLLVEAGADLSLKDEDGLTAVQVAAKYGNKLASLNS